jgi:hypothetical protein
VDWKPTPIAYPVTRTAGTDPGPPAEQLGGHVIALGEGDTALVVNADGVAQQLPLVSLRFDGLIGVGETGTADRLAQPWEPAGIGQGYEGGSG